jgi:hypothetical protein
MTLTLTLQVGGISDDTVKYGYGSRATRTSEYLHCKLYTRHLVREGAPLQYSSNCQTKEKKKKNIVMGPKGGPNIKTDLPTDRWS